MIVLDDAYLRDRARNSFANFWLGILIALSVLAALLYWLHSTTELAPAHDNVTQACAIFAAVLCFVSALIGFRKHPYRGVVGRLFRGAGYGLFGFAALFFAAMGCATIVEGWIDFPANVTRASQRLIAIADAHHSVGGRGSQSWTARIMSYDASLDITREDYGFMLAHRRPEDDASEPDRIASGGYFCARVTIEQAGDALRVVHAGSYTLPPGTVVVCPGEEGAILQKAG
jgi:hypothetical protein